MVKLILALLMVSCVTEQKQLNPDSFYKRDMKININGQAGEGVFVVPRSAKYFLDIEAKGKLDLFTFTTCHREETKESAWQDGGIFGKKNKVKVDYNPIGGLEDVGSCPIMLGGYEADKGRHSWAFIDFRTPEETLTAKLKCNGKYSEPVGVSACQSRAGLIQEIIFPEEVFAGDAGEACPMEKPVDNKTFRFVMNKELCVYAFMSPEGKTHRLTTLGYTEILIRGE